MKRRFLYVPLYIAVFLLLSCAVMFLWNALLPQIMNVKKVNYWQALGITALCRILLGRFNFGGLIGWQRGGPSNFLKEKLMRMSDEDKAAFKEEWRKKCEQFGRAKHPDSYRDQGE
jgi:hypothetical protein